LSIPRTADSINKPDTSPTEIIWSLVGSMSYPTITTSEDDEGFPHATYAVGRERTPFNIPRARISNTIISIKVEAK